MQHHNLETKNPSDILSDDERRKLFIRKFVEETTTKSKPVSLIRDDFFLFLQELPLGDRKLLIIRMPRNILELIHSDISLFIRSLLLLKIEDHSCFIEEFSKEHLAKVFLSKSLEDVLGQIDLTEHLGEKYHPTILYHCERRLLLVLIELYSDDQSENFANITENLRKSIARNTLTTSEDKLIIPELKEFESISKIYNRFLSLYNQRFNNKKFIDDDQIHLVFDIDDTIASHIRPGDNLAHFRWFFDNNMVLDIYLPGYLCIIHPGAIELMQYVFQIPNVRVSFFSEWTEERDILFVKEFLIRSLGEDRYNKVKNSITILSQCDLDAQPNSPKNLLVRNFGWAPHLKNLKRLSPSELKNTILIDDQPPSCHPGQETNMLAASYCSADYLSDSYDPYKTNHIFYIASVLDLLIKSKKSAPLTKTLFDFQFQEIKNGSAFDSKYEMCYEKLEINQLYRDGLSLLKQFNPSLEFYGSTLVKRLFNTDMNVKDHRYIQLDDEAAKQQNNLAFLLTWSRSFGPFGIFSYLDDKAISNVRSVNKTLKKESDHYCEDYLPHRKSHRS